MPWTNLVPTVLVQTIIRRILCIFRRRARSLAEFDLYQKKCLLCASREDLFTFQRRALPCRGSMDVEICRARQLVKKISLRRQAYVCRVRVNRLFLIPRALQYRIISSPCIVSSFINVVACFLMYDTVLNCALKRVRFQEFTTGNRDF